MVTDYWCHDLRVPISLSIHTQTLYQYGNLINVLPEELFFNCNLGFMVVITIFYFDYIAAISSYKHLIIPNYIHVYDAHMN